MKRTNFRYIILSIFAIILTIILQGKTALAASGSVTAGGGGTVRVGDTVSISLNVKSDETMYAIEMGVQYDSNVLEFVSGTSANNAGSTVMVKHATSSDNETISLKFKAKQPGTSSISLSGATAVGTDKFQLTTSGTSVTVAAPGNYSKDNSLKSLKISPGSLSPAFTPHTVNYTAIVPSSTSKLTVDAQVSNAAAKVISVTGANSLSAGRNDVKILVEAEDGTQATYTIVVTREQGAAVPTDIPEVTVTPEPSPSSEPELPPVTVHMDGKSLQIKSDFDTSVLPESFKVANLIYNGNEVIGATSLTGNLNLLYLTDTNDENGDLYIYDEESQSLYEYIEIEARGGRHIIIPYDESLSIPDNFIPIDFKINGDEISAWQLEGIDSDEYYIVYAIDGYGNKDFYNYDTVGQTFQRFSFDIMETLTNSFSEEDASSILEKESLLNEEMANLRAEHKEEISFRHKVIIALAILSALLLIFLTNMLLRNRFLKDDLAEYDDYGNLFDSPGSATDSDDIEDLIEEEYALTKDSKVVKDKTDDKAKDIFEEIDKETEDNEEDTEFKSASLEEIFEFLNVDDIDEDDLI